MQGTKAEMGTAQKLGQHLDKIFQDVSGQTRREKIARKKQNEAAAKENMQQALFTMVRCFHTSKIEDTPENRDEFNRAVFIYHANWSRFADPMYVKLQSINGAGLDMAKTIKEKRGIKAEDISLFARKVSDAFINHDGEFRKKVMNAECAGFDIK